jgi:phosphatidylglycerol:prolipoprotein diacylglycerol transferase
LVAGWLYCRKKGIDLWRVADILSVPAAIGLGLGRIANFINAELVGTVTTVKWCVDFGDGLCRHPYVLYDALGRFIVAGMIWPLRRVKPGFVFLTMVFLLGVERFIVDFYRDEILYLGLGVGQWMSLAMVVIAVFVFFKFYRGKVYK